jgi:predicted ATPase
MRGWGLAKQGQNKEGLGQILQGLATARATGSELVEPYFLALLAEVYGEVGQREAGLAVLAGALKTVDENGDRFYEAELYRLKGELLLKDEGGRMKDEVEACFWQAIEIARRQGAKSLELRATVSLGRLWQSKGKREEARRLLAEIYGWFTEGFDTLDLQEAKALLEKLSRK